MTRLQRTLIAAMLAAFAGLGIYEAGQNSQLRKQNQTLQRQRAPLTEQLQRLQRERDEATNRLASLSQRIASLESGRELTELLKLRSEVGVLRRMALLREAESSSPGGALSTVLNNPAQRELTRIQARESAKTKYAEMVRNLKLSPEAADKLFDLVADQETKKEGLFSELLSGDKDVSTALEDRTRSKKEMNDRIRALLGDANYEQYEHVNRDADAEETVNLLNRDLGTNAISGEPREKLKGLLAALPEIPMDGIDLFRSKESLAALFQQFEDLGNGILQQASAFLTPEQLSAAYAVRSNHINMYRSQITLGQQLVGKLREAQQ